MFTKPSITEVLQYFSCVFREVNVGLHSTCCRRIMVTADTGRLVKASAFDVLKKCAKLICGMGLEMRFLFTLRFTCVVECTVCSEGSWYIQVFCRNGSSSYLVEGLGKYGVAD